MNINDNIHQLFIDASGDNNIIHVDDNQAQILGAKNKIVHGVHQLIIVFNILKIKEQQISNYRAHFLKPISVNEEFEIEISRKNSHINVNIFNETKDFTTIMIKLTDPTSTNEISELNGSLVEANYKKIDYVAASGRFNFNLISEIYPDLSSYISKKFVLNLLMISYYFGVQLRTGNLMFVSINIELIKDVNSRKLVKTKSINNAELHNLHDGNFEFKSIGKKIDLSISRKSLVNSNFNLGRYSNQRALVLGGTGSLGRTLIQLLIRDQSEIHMTYNNSEKFNFSNSIEHSKVSSWKYTVNEDALPEIDGITHLYYFITPRIFTTNKRDFSHTIYQEFLDVYLVNLLKVYEKYRNSNLVMVFTPSTIAIEEKTFNLKEYIHAKNEMEKNLTNLNLELGKELFHFPRLPAFDSLQTVNIPLYMRKDPVEIVHEFIIPPI